jgi:hypothetical protein
VNETREPANKTDQFSNGQHKTFYYIFDIGII